MTTKTDLKLFAWSWNWCWMLRDLAHIPGNKMVKTVLQTDRDIGRHDKLKHLVIKSKCSQERFQAKQSWEKLLSYGPPDFVL